MKHIQLLDCTLRDGGLGLEDAYLNGISNKRFTKKDYKTILRFLKDSKSDIVEIGSIEISENDKTGFGIFKSVEELSNEVPKRHSKDQMFVGLYRGPDTPIESISNWNPRLVDGLRVIIRYSEMEKSLDFCEALANKGFKVFVQPMLTMRYTEDEIRYVIERTNKMGAYACYFVDSYGYMSEDDVQRLFNMYNMLLNPNIKIGFHAHNNMNLAYSNVLSFINYSKEREIIIDSCVLGMGQGAGNLQTELISFYLNKFGKKYNYNSILEVCEVLEPYYGQNAWGYSVDRLLPALLKTAYKYSIVFRKKYKMNYKDIYLLLCNMPDELKNRYTPENAEFVLKTYKRFL